ncbi:MAG: restriction endonuclease [Deltaproteobacteria bacterium]|nr:restriction endonuclease [Deltaproteobacteria bacterium]MBW1719067.1 restriction endonuclease [Deltaproteobacteria bacterium]MBW1937981.1 restriction endonuclease [Deltaproteobacteria bacterium]
MIDFTELPYTDDTWKLFARDFLRERGFFIESPLEHGPDAGKDLLITEQLKGNLNKYRFRWLVSYKHFATGRNSITEKDETNIVKRVSSFKADGFIGFYSSIASSGLTNRLNALRNENKIRDYSIFDRKLIENLLVTVGYSHLLMRYFPKSYRLVKPLHLVADEYQPLNCKVCHKDILMALFEPGYSANIVQIYKGNQGKDIRKIQDVYCACAYKRDAQIEDSLSNAGLVSGEVSIADLAIPIEFLRYVLATMNRIRDGKDIYTDEAFKKQKTILSAIAQKVLRATTEEEQARFKELTSLPL